jgi:type IV pilus assembly protein PilA
VNGIGEKFGRTEKFLAGGVAALVGAAILYFLVFPPYADYGPRAKLAEVVLGMSPTRSLLEDFYARHQRLPKDAAEARLPLDPVSKYIRNMAYDAVRGEVRSVVKQIPGFEGKTLVLRARIAGGKLEWQCFSPDIESKHLPNVCQSR